MARVCALCSMERNISDELITSRGWFCHDCIEMMIGEFIQARSIRLKAEGWRKIADELGVTNDHRSLLGVRPLQ